MLDKIRIKNLAIIEDLEIEFNSNFTALTGATGAGKSLLIDSLKLIFGKRADSDYIRHGKDDAVITAYFSKLSKHVKQYLKTLEINTESLIIERWISRKDRNKILINNKQTSLQDLKDLGLLLGDIHEQHDTTKLLDVKTALEMLDQFGKTNNILNEYTILRHRYYELEAKFHNAKSQTIKTQEKLEDLKYRLDEIKKANLVENELQLLQEKIMTLSHQKEIIESLDESYSNINIIDNQNLLYNSFKALEKIKSFSQSYETLFQRIQSGYYEFEDLKQTLFLELDSAKDASIDELEELQERFYFLKDLENKYKLSIEQLILSMEDLEEEILKYENFDLFIEKLELEKEKAFKEAYLKGKQLSERRRAIAIKLEKEFVEILKRLDISYVDFQIAFKEAEAKILLEDGIDEVMFLISLNKGEPLKPFYKVASGGELSRSMLALKIMYGKIHELDLMVFDEIDLGISGDAASKVANELFDLAQQRQVITITHLPQVAAKASKHYNIEKRVEGNRTITIINDLIADQRVYHLAYLLSGRNITEGAILHAKSLLDNKKSP